MNRIGVLAFGLAALAVAQSQPKPGGAESVIEMARKAALAFADSLPDFIVMRTTTRYRGARNPVIQTDRAPTVAGIASQQSIAQNPVWQTLDTISGNIATDHDKETYSNIVLNGKPAATLPARGVWSQGEFSAALLAVLSPATNAQFLARGRDLVRNRRANRYAFAVDQAHSQWSLPAETGSGTSAEVRYTPAFEGTLWIDSANGEVLQIQMSARDLPANYPSDTIEATIDYTTW